MGWDGKKRINEKDEEREGMGGEKLCVGAGGWSRDVLLDDMHGVKDRWMGRRENITDKDEACIGEGDGKVAVDEIVCDDGVLLDDME